MRNKQKKRQSSGDPLFDLTTGPQTGWRKRSAMNRTLVDLIADIENHILFSIPENIKYNDSWESVGRSYCLRMRAGYRDEI